MSRVSIGSKNQTRLRPHEPEPSREELKAFERFELTKYGFATGFDLSLNSDCQWLRGYRFAIRERA